MRTKINDFGEKIGGARKDLWRTNGLSVDDLYEMNEAEKKKYVVRNNVWPLKDAKKLVESGLEPFVVYWQRAVRRLTYSEPRILKGDDFEERLKKYIVAMKIIKNDVESVKNEDDIWEFLDKVRHDSIFIEEISSCTDTFSLKRIRYNMNRMKYSCEVSGFPFSSKKKTERKKSFIPPQLSHIEREGENYRGGMNVSPAIWQKEFNFRAVEFGNWMSQKDRQVSMNYCYDALKDLAKVLDIASSDIAFDGKLALAFGARGCSRSSAHYEPLRTVINLTKMHGAGCTAHEWFHALDDMLAKWCGVTDGKLASETKDKHLLPTSFLNLVNALKEDCDGNYTDYYRGSYAFGKHYAKDAHGYWHSNAEMLARAFACYVKDMHGKKSDYLIAHADVYEFEFDNQSICAIPQGEERELLNELFDQLFYELKKIGFLHKKPVEKKPKPLIKINEKTSIPSGIQECMLEGIDGQMRLIV